MTFAAACAAQIEPLGLYQTPELIGAIAERAAALGFSVSDTPLPSALASGWKKFLDASTATQVRETPEDVCVLSAFDSLTAKQSHALHNAFYAIGLKLGPSRTEMQLRAASRLFMLGRKGTFDTDDIGDHVQLLRSSIHHFDAAAEKSAFLPDGKLQRLFGMRGVARLLISRVTKTSASDLRRALDDLKLAHAKGENSEQNLVYRREAALRLCDFELDAEVLRDVEGWLAAPCVKDRQYFCDQALYYQNAAREGEASGGDPSSLLTLGISACDAGLQASADGSTPDAVFQNQRGYLRFIRRQKADSGLSPDVADLELAISDLRAAYPHGLGGATLPLALLRRAHIAHVSKDHEAALRYVNEGLEALGLVAGSEVAERARNKLNATALACSLASAIEAADISMVRRASTELLALGLVAHYHYSTLVYGMRFLIKAGVVVPALSEDQILANAILELDETDREGEKEEVEGHASFQDYLGGISRWLDGDIVSARTFGYFHRAISRPGPRSADLYSQGADVALQLGKLRSGQGNSHEATEFFEESTAWYERALEVHAAAPSESSASFVLVTCHSKAGEAYLRLRAGTLGTGAITEKAISHLSRSRELGNDAPELLGLLGDAHYRKGQSTGNKANLMLALELKAQARAQGHSSRESWSVAARINYRLFELSGSASFLGSAVDCALRANASSPEWPWPLFQLAELAALPAATLSAAIAQCAQDNDADAFRMLAARDRLGLLALGAELAASNVEFKRHILGGRTKVFVLEDPHRLLSTTIVLKPTSLADGRREAETTAKFAQHLADSGQRNRFMVPTPIAVLPRENAAIYVMARARATPLSDLIISASDAGRAKAIQSFTSVLDLLACFHRWAGPRSAPWNWKEPFARSLRSQVGSLGLPQPLVEETAQLLYGLLQPDPQFVQKKDAHPENWLVSGNGSVVMLDLEATSSVPALLDVAQLLEDYPAFEATADGWHSRIDLAVRHHEGAFGAKPQREQVARAYVPFLILRCAFGLSHSSHEQRKQGASAAVKAHRLRLEHYWHTLEFVASGELGSEARRLADILLSARQ